MPRILHNGTGDSHERASERLRKRLRTASRGISQYESQPSGAAQCGLAASVGGPSPGLLGLKRSSAAILAGEVPYSGSGSFLPGQDPVVL